MCAKNLVNGTHACDSAALIGVLEKDWHFPGFVVSDFSSIHSTVQAANAGTSLELPSVNYFGPALATAVNGGQVSRATVDGLVHRIFFAMFRLGLFDRPAPSPRPIPAARDGATALALAEAGTVLLKNHRGALPLDRGRLKSVALIGPEAGTASAGGAGSPKVAPIQTVSPLQAISAGAARHHITVHYAGAPPVNLGPTAIPSYALTPAGRPGRPAWPAGPVLQQQQLVGPAGGVAGRALCRRERPAPSRGQLGPDLFGPLDRDPHPPGLGGLHPERDHALQEHAVPQRPADRQ